MLLVIDLNITDCNLANMHVFEFSYILTRYLAKLITMHAPYMHNAYILTRSRRLAIKVSIHHGGGGCVLLNY